MSNKKYVAIVLVVGLLLSIGCAVSQMEVFTNPLLEAQPIQSGSGSSNYEIFTKPMLQIQPTQSPSLGQPTTPPLEAYPTQSGSGSSNADWTGSISIDKYAIVQFSQQTGDELAGINCYSGGKRVGSLFFMKDDGILYENSAQTVEGTKYVVLYYHYNKYNDILDMLRNGGEINLVFLAPHNARIESRNIEVPKAP